MQNQLFRQENLILSSSKSSQRVKLIFRVLQNSKVRQVYEGYLPSVQQDERLGNFFQADEDILDHLKNKQNIEIDVHQMTAKIIFWVNKKKNKRIQVFQMLLTPMRKVKDKITKIMKDCKTQGQLSSNFLKESIKTLTECIYEIISQKQQKLDQKQNLSISQAQFISNFQAFKDQILNQVKKTRDEVQADKSIQLQKIRQTIKPLTEKLDERIKKIQSRYDEEYEKIVEQVKQLNEKVQQQINEKVEQISKMFITSQEIETIINKIKILGGSYEKMRDMMLKINKINNIYSPFDIVDFNQHRPFISQFLVEGNFVSYIGKNKTSTQYIFNKPIPYNKQYSFKIKMSNLGENPYYLSVGILDYFERRDERSAKKNSFSYYRNSKENGFKYPEGITEGNGFGQDDILTVTVNLSKKIISWSVDDEQQASSIHQVLSDHTKTFMPFIDFFYSDTVVQWIEDE